MLKTLLSQHIGDENNHRIQYKYNDYKDHWIQSIEGSISTGQFDDILVKAECLGKDMGMAIREKIKGNAALLSRYHSKCIFSEFFHKGLHEDDEKNGILTKFLYKAKNSIHDYGTEEWERTKIQEVIHLACTDTTFNNLYGLILVMFTVVLDLVLIALSYGVILHTVARLASKEERLRAFQTCTSHLCAVLEEQSQPYHGLCIKFSFPPDLQTYFKVCENKTQPQTLDTDNQDKRVLSHSFCLHQEVIHLACTDTTLNNLYGLSLVVFTVMLDLVLIALSYGVILHTVARLASKEEQLRAFQTCTSHLCAVLVFFVPMMGLSLVHRFGKNAPPAVHLLMANVYLFVPPMLNPIIYSIKTKEIRRVISKLLG
ncbi:hypothetical protein MG293_012396 [Ovis ammon polii]|uniref:G-protein coupled receptors family 1 profile domain-containing protein n=1 Tax=Ovis ammon polii TaxID=230172 RepID=A0AAD4U0Y8_OVIAM|nr:hypothetical protein MG293_012396 [Ovis ammon polii]